MTRLEKAFSDIESLKERIIRGCCPGNLGVGDCDILSNGCSGFLSECDKCWNQEYVEDEELLEQEEALG